MLNNYSYTLISTNTTTTILNGIGSGAGITPANQGVLHTITIGGPGVAGGSVVVYDNPGATGAVLAAITVAAAAPPVTLTFDAQLRNGLTIVTSGMTTPYITATWA